MGDAITKANRFARFLWDGGSNCIGEPTTGAPSVTRPSNVTYRTLVAGVATTVADWSTLTQHGTDVYVLDYLVRTMGYTGPIVSVNHGVAGTNAATWESTHCAAAITSWNAVSPSAPPGAIIRASGGGDAQSVGVYNAFDQDTLDCWALYSAAFGAGFARIILETPSPQGVDFPYADLLRLKQRAHARVANDCSAFVETYDSNSAASRYELLDTQHRSPAGNRALAPVVARLLFPLLP